MQAPNPTPTAAAVVPPTFYPSPAWWTVETGCPSDSYLCEDCCRRTIDAAWKRRDDKVRAERLTNVTMNDIAELEGALVCDFCGVHSAYVEGGR